MIGAMPHIGWTSRSATFGRDRGVHLGADRAGLDLGRERADLDDRRTPRGAGRSSRGARVRVVGEVLDVAPGLAPVPQHLQLGEDERAVEVVRVGGLEDRLVLVEVDRCGAAGAVVHARVRRARRASMSGDTAASIPPTMPPWLLPSKNRRAVSRATCRRLERRASEARPVFISRPRKIWSRTPCCSRSGMVGKLRDVLQGRDRVADVVLAQAGPLRGAEHDVVVLGHRVDVARRDLRSEPSSPWPYIGDPRRAGAGERRRRGCCRGTAPVTSPFCVGQPVATQVEALSRARRRRSGSSAP